MRYVIIAALIALSGCTPRFQSLSAEYPVVPDELKDCVFFAIKGTQGGTLNVIRCPNSSTSTTYQSGKTTVTTVVIDGETYVKKSDVEKVENEG